jgi:hypothetical protein
MAKNAETARPLMLEPKALKMALKQSAERAQRIADALRLNVPAQRRSAQAAKKFQRLTETKNHCSHEARYAFK